MWMASNYGIIRFDRKDESFRQFGMADGIQNFEYNAVMPRLKMVHYFLADCLEQIILIQIHLETIQISLWY